MNQATSIKVIYDNRTGCEGWYARVTEGIDGEAQERDIPLDCDVDADDEELAGEARSEARMDGLLSCTVPDDFPVEVRR